MIIPIRCFTCGMVIADKWRAYEGKCAALKDESNDNKNNKAGDASDSDLFANAPRGKILNDLGITRMCCRIHFLTHVDL